MIGWDQASGLTRTQAGEGTPSRYTVPEKKFPHVAVMARQYLGVPASSAIVERIFSFAGCTFSDLRKSLDDTTLEDFMWIRWASDK
jgi:hypothetical protein